MKYDGINPLSKLHEGEPYFFLRAQDTLAIPAVAVYAVVLEHRAAAERGKVAKSLRKAAREVRAMAKRMSDWQKKNPQFVKLPD